MINPADIKVFAVDNMGSVEGSVSFRFLCGVLSLPFVFGLNSAFECDPSPRQTFGGTLCFWSALV